MVNANDHILPDAKQVETSESMDSVSFASSDFSHLSEGFPQDLCLSLFLICVIRLVKLSSRNVMLSEARPSNLHLLCPLS